MDPSKVFSGKCGNSIARNILSSDELTSRISESQFCLVNVFDSFRYAVESVLLDKTLLKINLDQGSSGAEWSYSRRFTGCRDVERVVPKACEFRLDVSRFAMPSAIASGTCFSVIH